MTRCWEGKAAVLLSGAILYHIMDCYRMERRAVLLGCATALTGLAACVSGDEQGPATPEATSTTTDKEDSATSEATSTTNRRETFKTVIHDAVDAEPSFSFENDTWEVSYHYDLCCVEENLRPHQLALAKNFTAVQPDGVTVALTTTHECQRVEWAVSPDVARQYREGELSEAELTSHIEESSERIGSC